MNADQHPALTADYDDVPNLTLILPGRLGNDETLGMLAQAIEHARRDVVERALQFRRLAEGRSASGDPVRQALLRGQALGGEQAAATIDEAIVAAFGLWHQYEAQVPSGGGGAAGSALPASEVPAGRLWRARAMRGRLSGRLRLRRGRRDRDLPGSAPGPRG
jgi:hypothetical protein